MLMLSQKVVSCPVTHKSQDFKNNQIERYIALASDMNGDE